MDKKYHGIYKKYKKLNFLKTLDSFLKSNNKILVLEYSGDKLNSIVGIQDEIKHEKVKLSFLFRLIKIKIFQQPLFRIIRFWNGGEFKNKIYRFFGMNIGKDVFIAPDVYIDDLIPELITIEDGCIIGEGSSILAHEFSIRHARFARVNIGKQVIIGAYSIVRSGITIGDKAIVAMDSLINKDVPSSDEVGGVPEHEIKKLKKLI